MRVVFSHGKESGPWGSKIKRLAKTAESLGLTVASVDYTGIVSPDDRVSKLCEYLANEQEDFVLVGSSMGGYVSLVAAEKYSAQGVFLLAPALYIDDYCVQEYSMDIKHLEIVHGWSDEVIPVHNSIKYAEQALCTLHLVDGDHRLTSALKKVNDLFDNFLKQILIASYKR
jgi:alpha/beta superfamily hydrolase